MSGVRPTTEEILRSVLWTYEHHIAPEVEDDYASSLSLTITNLLRHCIARVELEGPALWDDNRDLRAVLREIRHVWPDAIDDAVARRFRDPEDYPTMTSLRDEAIALRTVLVKVIEHLHHQTDEGHDDPEAHDKVKAYLGRSLQREAPWMLQAWSGPRR